MRVRQTPLLPHQGPQRPLLTLKMSARPTPWLTGYALPRRTIVKAGVEIQCLPDPDLLTFDARESRSSIDFPEDHPLGSSSAYDASLRPPGALLVSERAYVLINVMPGQTGTVVKALADIKEIKTIDPCWGKPDLFVIVEVPDQDALTS